jgi:hypothetical protein
MEIARRMTDVDAFLVALAGFYLIECLVWIPEDCLAFVSRLGNRWHEVRPGQCFGNQRGGLLLLNPVPSWGGVFLCQSSPAANARLTAATTDATGNPLDTRAVAMRLDESRRHARGLRPLCVILWLCLFVAVPLLVRTPEAIRYLKILLVACAAQMAAIAMIYSRAYGKLYPGEKDARQLALVALFPPATIRAHDALTRRLLARFHPLAVAKVLAPEADFKHLARELIFENRHLLPDSQPAGNPDQMRMAQTLEKFCAEAGLDLHELDAPPQPLDATCRSYCPRCRAQFTTLEGECTECIGIKLRPIQPGNHRPA